MPTHPAHDCSTPIPPVFNSTATCSGEVNVTMRAALIADDSRIVPATTSVPALPSKGALLRVIGCSICGSDLDKIVHRKATEGTVLGHEVVGHIIELAPDAPSHWTVGDRMVVSHHVPCGKCHYCQNGSEPMCRTFKQTNLDPGGFAEIVALSERHLQHTAFAIPDSTDNETASCVEPLACVLRAIRRGVSQTNKSNAPGKQSVLIAGLGFIGLLAAQVYQHQGTAVTGVDIDSQRLAWAFDNRLVSHAFHPMDELDALKQHLVETTPLGQVDIVFLTAVNPASVALALQTVRDGGTIILFASGREGVAFDAQTLYFREISIIPSYSPELQDLQAAAQMLFANVINANALVSHRMPLSAITEAVEQYRTGQARKVFIEIEQANDG